MGQHKYNETAKLAKEGKLPPKKKPMSTAERRRRIEALMYQTLVAPYFTESQDYL